MRYPIESINQVNVKSYGFCLLLGIWVKIYVNTTENSSDR